MTIRQTTPIIIFILVLAISSSAASIVEVKNSGNPDQGISSLELDELWRIGGHDSEQIFGTIQRVLVGPDDNVYLLDSQLGQVLVFSSNGEFLRTVGGQGDGPGEFRTAVDMCFLPNGNLGIAQMFPGVIVEIGLNGTPVGKTSIRSITGQKNSFLRTIKSGGPSLVSAGYFQKRDKSNGNFNRSDFVGLTTKAGIQKTILSQFEYTLDMAHLKLDESQLMASPYSRFDVGASGKTAIAIPRYGYEISFFNIDGSLEHVISRPYESWKRSPEAKNRWVEIFESVKRSQAPGATIHVEDFEPDIMSLQIQPDGKIWVLSSRGMWATKPGVFAVFDVFSPQGSFESQVEIRCDCNPTRDMMFRSGENRFYVVTGYWDAMVSQFGGRPSSEEDTAPMQVICYRKK